MSGVPEIPDHTLLRLIGRGSYGEVWLARNVMGAGRAVKVVRRAAFDSDRPFEREFAAVRRYEPASRMADGLVNVLHAGRSEDGELFYYVMELADDDATQTEGTDRDDYRPRTLRSVMDQQKRLPLADCMAVAQSLVQALASLHRVGLTHRDIKPSNIIFVNGRAKLADIGLVGDLGESRSFVGTEGYIPPEGPGLPGADLYALGMVLYEMATGYAPVHYPRVPVEWMQSGAGPEMEFVEVVLHATEPDAARRYVVAGELLADLALLESGKSVRRVHRLERRWQAAKRFAAAAALTILLLGGGMWLWHRETLRETRAVSAEALAAQAQKDARTQRFLALREHAASLVRSELNGWRQPALRDIAEAAKLNPDDRAMRNTLITAFSRADITDSQRWTQPGDDTAGPVMSPDMSLVAVADADGSFRIRRTADGTEVQHVRHWLTEIQPSFESCFTPDSRYLGVRFRGMRTLRPVVDRNFLYEAFTWFRVSDGKVALELQGPVSCGGGALADGHHVLAWDAAGRALAKYDLDSGREVSRLPLAMEVLFFRVSPDNKLVLLQTEGDNYGGKLVVVDAETGRERCRWPELAFMRDSAVWTPDSRQILLGSSAAPHGVRILQTDGKNAPGERLVLHSAEVVDLAVSPDGRHLLSSSWDQTTLLTDLVLRRTVAVLPGSGPRGSLGFSADGRRCWRRVVEGGKSTDLIAGTIELPLTTLIPVPGVAHGTSFSADGRWLAAAWAGGLQMHDFASGRTSAVPGVGPAACCEFAIQDGQPVCAVSTLSGLRLVTREVDATSRATWRCGEPLSQGQVDVITSPADGSRLLVWGGEGDGVEVQEGKPRPWTNLRNIVSAAISASGELSACASGAASEVILLDATGQETGRIPCGTRPWVGLSADGTRVSANTVDRISCWDTASRQLLWERPKDFPFIRGSPQHTPDGRFVIVRTGLHPALLDARTGETWALLEPAQLAHTTHGILSADGNRLALTGRNFVLVWDLQAVLRELRECGMRAAATPESR